MNTACLDGEGCSQCVPEVIATSILQDVLLAVGVRQRLVHLGARKVKLINWLWVPNYT